MSTVDLVQAAAMLGAHPETVRLKAKAGELPGRKVASAGCSPRLRCIVTSRENGFRELCRAITRKMKNVAL
ncbi:hypothetical protein [Burkholderia sp. WSM2230]|uniref:hypothetical protein n=1 Tax=Burkholderia sp. WSM2230 TaxID=944435 RepID=UPI0012EB29B6|nr:hypothetical protein [Burkholderia sp. WSM2230]